MTVIRRSAWLLLGIIITLNTIDQLAPVDLTPRTTTVMVTDRNGEPLRAFADEQGIWRYPTSTEQVSENYLNALLTFEDSHYFSHPGINPFSLMRAFGQWLNSGEIVSGGSTLTMQVARLRYGQAPGIGGKMVQMWRALQLEWHYSKTDILNYYLNHAPFGGAIEGVEAASRSYFGHSAELLTDAQAALLAGLPQAPSYYRPDRHPERATYQRNKVLKRQLAAQTLSLSDYDSALLEPVQVQRIERPLQAPLLARYLRQQQPDSGLITSTLDRQVQQPLRQLTSHYAQQLPPNASLAAVVMRHGDGHVLGYVGSADFSDNQRFAHVDMVQANRSPGSTLKPFIYGQALDEGIIHSESLLMDVPLVFADYQPSNFDRGFSGPVSTSQALKQSLNLPAVQILEQIGPARFYSQLANAGMPLQLPQQAKPSLAIALGGTATNLLSLTQTYSALANAGKTIAPVLTLDTHTRSRHLLSPEAAWIVRNMLQDNQVAVKTGTSAGYRDTWAMAVTTHYTIGVWIGMPDNQAMSGYYGGIAAKPLAQAIANQLPRQSTSWHSKPDNVQPTQICWPARAKCDQTLTAWTIDERVPNTLMHTKSQPQQQSQVQYWRATDTGLRVSLGCVDSAEQVTTALWPAPLQSYLPNAWRTSQRLPAVDPRCSQNTAKLNAMPVEIVGIDDKARFRRHATTETLPSIVARANGGQPPWFWFLNGELLTERGSRLAVPVSGPGAYQLSVTDPTGAGDKVEFFID